MNGGQFLFRYRDIVFPVILLVLAIVLRPRVPAGSVVADAWLDAVGLVITIAGLVLRGWVIGLQYITRAGANKEVYAERLVTGGVFSCARNPLYVGNLLGLIGVVIIFNNVIMYVVAIAVGVCAYQAIVAAEETFLAARFGDEYRHYCARVNRWLPNPRCLIAASRGSKFNWRRVIGADYNTDWTALTSAVAIMIYERLAAPAYASVTAMQLVPFWAALAGLCVLYIVARVLKKNGHLGQR